MSVRTRAPPPQPKPRSRKPDQALLLGEPPKPLPSARWVTWAVGAWAVLATVALLVVSLWGPSSEWKHVRFNSSAATVGGLELYAPHLRFDRVRRYETCCRSEQQIACGASTRLTVTVLRPQTVHVVAPAGSDALCEVRWRED